MKISPITPTPNAHRPAPADLRELLRLSLDGLLPPASGLSHLFDRLEGSR